MEFVNREYEVLWMLYSLQIEQLDFSPIKLKRTNSKSNVEISLKSL